MANKLNFISSRIVRSEMVQPHKHKWPVNSYTVCFTQWLKVSDYHGSWKSAQSSRGVHRDVWMHFTSVFTRLCLLSMPTDILLSWHPVQNVSSSLQIASFMNGEWAEIRGGTHVCKEGFDWKSPADLCRDSATDWPWALVGGACPGSV